MTDHLTENQIARLVAGACEDAEFTRLAAHLRTCSSCADDHAYAARAQATWNARAEGDRVPEADGALVQLGLDIAAPVVLPSSRRRVWIRAAAAAAFILLTGAAIRLATQPSPAPPSLEVTLAVELTDPIRDELVAMTNRGPFVLPGTEADAIPEVRRYRASAAPTAILLDPLNRIIEREEESGGSPETMYWLMAGFLATGQLRVAEDVVARAQTRFPDHPSLVALAAMVAVHDGRLDEAETRLRRALDLNPNDAVSTLNLAILLDRRDADDEAADLFRRADRNAPGTPVAARARSLAAGD